MPDIANIVGMLDRDGALHLGEDAHEYRFVARSFRIEQHVPRRFATTVTA